MVESVGEKPWKILAPKLLLARDFNGASRVA